MSDMNNLVGPSGIAQLYRDHQELQRIARLQHPTDEQRRTFNAGVFIEHSGMVQLREAVARAITANTTAARPERRRLVAVEGNYLGGKTSALLQLAAEQHQAHPPRSVVTGQYRTTTQPVVFLQCPSDGERGLAAALLRALECDARPRATASEMLAVAARWVQYRQVRVVILDDANLLQASRRGEALTAFLRQMLAQVPATLVFAGKDVGKGPLAAIGRTSPADQHAAQQLSRRTIPVHIASAGEGRARAAWWLALINSAAGTYLLDSPQPVALAAAELVELVKIAKGQPGKLLEILGTAAACAVGGSERIDPDTIRQARIELGGPEAAAC